MGGAPSGTMVEKLSLAAGSMVHIYRFLALSMRYPEGGWLNDQYLIWLFGLLAGAGLRKEVAALHRRLACGSWLEELQEEHALLFINGLTCCTPAPPSGHPSEPALAREKDAGLATPEKSGILERELELLALLYEAGEGEDLENYLGGHFRPWFGAIKIQVEKEASHPFYPTVMKLIEYFTREEN